MFPVTKGFTATLSAFPGAEGFGARKIKGGRGGKVIKVTNLHDKGKGSLRSCIDAKGKRTCIFTIGGTIMLNSSLVIRNPYITIAGQTARGGGITLRNSSKNIKSPLLIQTHNVIVRYIRSRPGPNKNEDGNIDAITIGNKKQTIHSIIIDHCSFSWATDELFNIWYNTYNIIAQWNILNHGLNNSTHKQQGKVIPHSYGMLIGSSKTKNITIHHNLFGHNKHRNPKISAKGVVDIVNNVMYNTGSGKNWLSPSYLFGKDGETVKANVVGNYLIPGPNTGKPIHFFGIRHDVAAYFKGNKRPKGVPEFDLDRRDARIYRRYPATAITTDSPSTAYARLLKEAGASRYVNCAGKMAYRRDRVDRNFINDVKKRKGKIIDSPSQVGGWPYLSKGKPCLDSDNDGMPDDFEKRFKFNHRKFDSNGDRDGDGYTNLEEYLNGTMY